MKVLLDTDSLNVHPASGVTNGGLVNTTVSFRSSHMYRSTIGTVGVLNIALAQKAREVFRLI